MMLGTTAGGLFWMFRFLERCENTARLLEAGLRIALTKSSESSGEWESVVLTTGATDLFEQQHDRYDRSAVIDFLLRNPENPSSVLSLVDAARNNARSVRTALTREVWEATNDCWMVLRATLAHPVSDRDLPKVLGQIRRESALVRGALHGTMLRNDIYDFSQLGMFVERADNTARILDVKYYILLPSVSAVGSRLDTIQWETILRSVSAQRAFRFEFPGAITPRDVAAFLILDPRMPRSLAYCYSKIRDNLEYIAFQYDDRRPSHDVAAKLIGSINGREIENIFDSGLHEFLRSAIGEIATLAHQIEIDYRFTK
jgi:uncharacterized alpha-E superfamily protein